MVLLRRGQQRERKGIVLRGLTEGLLEAVAAVSLHRVVVPAVDLAAALVALLLKERRFRSTATAS